jgi:hypothetical protein
MNTEVYLDSRFGLDLGDSVSGRYFILREPLFAPPGSVLTVQVTSATVPLTHWALNDGNNDLHLIYADGSSQSISLLMGNRSIDLIVLKMNEVLMHGWVASYDDTTNLISFNTGVVPFAVGPLTDCQTPLGVAVGDASVGGTYTTRGIDISGTQCFFLRSNLNTQNTQPFTSNAAGVLARIPITRAPNDIERWVNTTGVVNVTTTNCITLLYLDLLDDTCQTSIELHGGHWSVTLIIGATEPSNTFSALPTLGAGLLIPPTN